MKINFKRLLKFILLVTLTTLFLLLAVDFLLFPEKYVTTWKYQLKNDILRGNNQAIEYYQTNYIDKGVELFEI